MGSPPRPPWAAISLLSRVQPSVVVLCALALNPISYEATKFNLDSYLAARARRLLGLDEWHQDMHDFMTHETTKANQ